MGSTLKGKKLLLHFLSLVVDPYYKGRQSDMTEAELLPMKFNHTTRRKAKIVYSFGLFECNRLKFYAISVIDFYVHMWTSQFYISGIVLGSWQTVQTLNRVLLLKLLYIICTSILNSKRNVKNLFL